MHVYGRIQEFLLVPFHHASVGIPPVFEGLWVGCDAACSNLAYAAIIGVIVQDDIGAIVDGIKKKGFTSSALISKALAIWRLEKLVPF